MKKKLTDGFQAIKNFCNSRDLVINIPKTQVILFKTPTRRLVDEFELMLDGYSIKAESSVKLLGMILD